MKLHNFSIIIPAHNEERYLEKSLKHILSLNYPKNKFETIVVENGSTDRTYKIAKKLASKNIKVFSIKDKGVSRARNFGATKASDRTEWIIFLDAYVLLKKDFLRELNEFLKKKEEEERVVIGTTELVPIKKTFRHGIWFRYHNWVHKLFRLSISIQIVDKKIFKKVGYDENLKFSEDIKLIREMTKYGKFFYMPTKNVEISTRRFDKEGGHLRVLLKWGYMNSLPYKLKIKKDYRVVR